MTRRILHFTLGPVQGFIADARRTRDFWAGSFLLSWLSGKAMAALVAEGGKIIFPQVANDELFDAIRGKGGTPYIGSLPNRFKADVTDISDPAKICEDAICKSWKELAEAVRKQYIDEIAKYGKDTAGIWNRQVDHFWDMNWVVGDDPGDGSDGRWLDERKNWRSQFIADEGGDLCRLMGRYQEISGYHRIGSKKQQQDFWDKLAGKTSSLNLRPDERLCAIALIKRLFPVLKDIKNIIGWKPGDGDVDIEHWPSTSYIAAVPWLKKCIAIGEDKKSEYWQLAKDNLEFGFMGETDTTLFGLPKNGIFKLDGHLLHPDGIRSWSLDKFKGGDDNAKTGSRVNLLNGLLAIKADKQVGNYASEFYAVLIMDGDRIGEKVGKYPGIVKTGLAEFTSSVKNYFKPGKDNNPANGVLIYAGGDDVLALVPVDHVVKAARDLREKYKTAFERTIKKQTGTKAEAKDFTMSAAVVFAQYKIPLRAVLRQAHHYIDDIAKDKNGRDSLAIAVMKPGGIAYSWVSGWESGSVDPVASLETVVEKSADKNPEYSTSFLYNIRERYTPLFSDPRNEDEKQLEEQEIDPVFADASFMEKILVAEYKKQPGKSKLDVETVEKDIAPLMVIGKPIKQKAIDDKYHFEGALVARFIAGEKRND